MSYGLSLDWRGPIGDYIGFGETPVKEYICKFSPGLIWLAGSPSPGTTNLV